MNVYKQKRKEFGFNRQEAADLLGINIASLDAIESGFRSPGKILLYKFSNLYKCTMNELLEAEKSQKILA